MITAKSSFSMGRLLPVYRNALGRFWGTGVMFGVLGFLFLPLQFILTLLNRSTWEIEEGIAHDLIGPAQCYNGFAMFFFFALCFIVPLVLAANLFGYMHNKRSTDVYHALPLTRAELFFALAAAGVTLIWVPLLINFGIVAIASTALPSASMLGVAGELVCWLMVTLVIFAVTAFASVQVGTVFDTVAFSLVLNGSLAAIYGTFMVLAETFLYGFSSRGEVVGMNLIRLSPVSLIVGRQVNDNYSWYWDMWGALLVWGAVGLVLLGLTAWLYGRRKSEQAEQVGDLGPLQIYVRAVGTLVAGCLFGMMLIAAFSISTRYASLPMLGCLGLGMLLAYVIGDIILTRSLKRLKKAIVPGVLTTLALCLAISAVMFDWIGFSKRIPASDSVTSIEMSLRGRRYNGMDRWDYLDAVSLQSPEAIELMRTIHKEQVDSYQRREDNNSGSWFDVTYRLKSGGQLERRYWSMAPAALEDMTKLESLPEFVEKAHPIFQVQPEELRGIELQNTLGDWRERLQLTLTQRQQLIEALRKDLLAQGPEELLEGAPGRALLYLDFSRPRTEVVSGEETQQQRPTATSEERPLEMDLVITERFTNTIALLQGMGKGQLLQNDWSQVNEAYIYSYDGKQGDSYLQVGRYEVDRYTDSYGDKYADTKAYPGEELMLLSGDEVRALQKELKSLWATSGQTVIKLQVSVNTGEGPQAMGAFYLPVSALNEGQLQRLRDWVEVYYGEWMIEELDGSHSGVLATEEMAVALANERAAAAVIG